MDILELKARVDIVRGRRREYESDWQDISDLALPYRGDITTKASPSDDILSRNRGVFDSTATQAADAFSNFLKSTIFPSTLDWLKLQLPDRFEGNIQARDHAQATARRILAGLSTSNFYNQVDHWIADTGILGTGTMYGEERPALEEDEDGSTFGGFRFEAAPIGRVYFLMGIDGTVFIVREKDIMVSEAFREFGYAGQRGMKHLKDGNPTETLCYLNIQWFNEDGIPGGLRHATEKPWISVWALEDSNQQPLEVIRMRGQDLSSYMVARWIVRDGEEYGRGQGHIARPDMMGVNKLKELVLDAAGVDLKPPFLVENETQIDLDLGPSGLAVVTPPQKITPQFLPSGARYDVANSIGLEDRQNIKRAFMSDFLDDPEFQDRSAEAVRDRQIRASQRLAPRADKIYHEMVVPLIQFCMNRMAFAGALPELALLEDMGVSEMRVEPISPFFTAQKEAPAVRLQAWMEQWKRNAIELQRPEILDKINMDGAIDLSAQLTDIPSAVINSDQEVQRIREARAQAQEQQRQIDQAEQLASAAGKAAPALNRG